MDLMLRTAMALAVFTVIYSKNLPPVRNVEVTSINMNHLLHWKAPEFDKPVNVTVYYSVFFEDINETTDMWSWFEVPGCIHVTHMQCRLPNEGLSHYVEHRYAVQVQAGNDESVRGVPAVDFAPYDITALRAPNFTVSVKDKLARLTLEKLPTSMWSNNTLLIELVPNDRIHYDIEYWPKQNETQKLRMKASVKLRTIEIYLKEARPYCFRMRMDGSSFKTEGWSESICSEETSVSSVFLLPQETDSTTLHAILGALGSGVGLVFFVLLFVYFTRLHHYLNGKGDEIPASLAQVMAEGDVYQLQGVSDTVCEEAVTSFLRPPPHPRTSGHTFVFPAVIPNPHVTDGLPSDSEEPTLNNIKNATPNCRDSDCVSYVYESVQTAGFEPPSVLPSDGYVAAPLSPDSGLVDCYASFGEELDYVLEI